VVRPRGYTLIELLIVLTIVGLVAGLVGGIAVDRVEKAQVQTEARSVERLLRGLAFEAFARGRPVRLRADGARLTWSVPGEADRHRDLEHWFFAPPQDVEIDASGIARPDQLLVVKGREERRIAMNEWLGESR
jgi:prepilin-type N-terminal cleavage/methylation domain-containing protein